MARFGILTSGGDAPGMNAAIRAAVRTATSDGHEIIAYRNGYTGLVEQRWTELDERTVSNIIQLGGTIIGTSRSKAFMEASVRARCGDHLKEMGIEGLIVIGGDGSFRGALALQDEVGVKVVGVPGTIDNDVFGTDETIGFDTAVNTAVEAIDRVRDTGESTGMIFYVEVMGRSSGAIALHAGVAGGAAAVLAPETPTDVDDLVGRLKRSIERGKRSHIIIVSEGDEAGGAFAVADRVGEKLDHEYRVVILGHTQRGGAPTARDRLVAAFCGSRAVEALAEGRSGIMVGMQDGQVAETPLARVVAEAHSRPETDLLALARRLSR